MTRDTFLRLAASLVIIILIFALHRAITVGPRPDRPVFAADHPLLLADGGASNETPENTLIAFQQAVAEGADGLAVDVRLTADGELVAVRDPTVDRTTNGTGLVRAKTLAELDQLDAGYQFTPDGGQTYPFRGQAIVIPTLDDIYDAFPGQIISVELQDDLTQAADRLAQTIARHQATDRTIVGSQHSALIRYFRRLAPDVATAASSGEVRTFYLLQLLHLWRFHRPLADVYQVPTQQTGFHFGTTRFVSTAHRLNQKVFYGVVDDPAEMQRLLSLGADGIITSRPDVAKGIITDQG